MCAQVGFEQTVVRVSNVSSGECEAVVSRYGKFGDVTVRWNSGFPKGSSANAFSAGIILPPAGTYKIVMRIKPPFCFVFKSKYTSAACICYYAR